MGIAGGPLFHLAVDDERPHAQLGLIGAGSGGVARDRVGDLADRSEGNGMRLGPSGEGQRRRERKSEGNGQPRSMW